MAYRTSAVQIFRYKPVAPVGLVVTLEYYYDLVALVLDESNSHRGEILNLFATMQKRDQLLRASINSSVAGSRCNSTRVDEGRKCWILLALKMKARTVVGRGEEGPLCDPGSELLVGGSTRVVRG